MKLLAKFNLILALVFALGLLPVGLISYSLLQRNARAQVVQNARIMMRTAMAMRGYTINQIQPLLETISTDKFLPQSVPAYSATEIFNYLRESSPEFTYKEAVLNPTNPRDRAVEWETDVINEFRNRPETKEMIGERTTPSGRALYLSQPIRVTDAKCLTCHTTPDIAPAHMIAEYGPNNGFGWKLNETIGAQIVSVPMSVPVGMARHAFVTLFGSMVGVFAVILLVLNLLLRLTVIRPISRLSQMADQVSVGNMETPEIEIPGNDEVATLAGSFNRMRISLVKALRLLEAE